MKKVVVIGGVLIGLLVGGVAICLATFNADRYRPLVVKQLESALGRPVQLAHLSLGWRGGIALELKQLAISSKAATTEPAVQVETLSAVVRLLPLLRKEVQVSSITLIRPRVQVRRDAQGNVDLLGLAVVAGPASLNIASLKVEEGSLHWTDAMASPPVDLWVTSLDATLKNVSLTRPIEFQLRLAAFSDGQNLHLRGRLQMPTKDRAGLLEGVRLETDFNRLNVAQLTQALPAVKEAGLRELAGNLVVSIDRAGLDPQGLGQLAARVRLSGGRLVLARLGSPIEGVTVEALAQRGRVDLRRGAATFAGGTIAATGTMEQLKTQPRASLHVTIDKLALDALLPTPGPDEPQLRGRLSASFHGTGQGLAIPQLTQTLSGEGHLAISDGVIANLNVLREVFRRLSIFPGLVETLQARLPESSQAKLAARDTVLQPIEVSVIARNGALAFDHLRVATDSFELNGAGRVGFDGTFMCQSMLQIDPALSAAIIKSVKELQPLTDTGGRLQLPVVIQGSLPRVAVLPDVQAVASRLVATKAEELFGTLLEKALENR